MLKRIPLSRMVMYAVLLGLAVAMCVSLRNCHSVRNGEMGQGRRSGGDTIDVAIEYAPLSMYAYSDTTGGFDYDMLRYIAAKHGLTLKFHPISGLSRGVEGLRRGHYRLLAANIPATAGYDSENLRFSEPLFLDRQVLVQRRDSLGMLEVQSQLDLAGKRVRVVSGSPMQSRLMNLADEIGDSIILEADSVYGPEQLFLLVATGEIPFAVINRNTARQLAPRYPSVDIGIEISFNQFRAWALNSTDSVFADSIDRMIVDFKASEEYPRLLRRYNL